MMQIRIGNKLYTSGASPRRTTLISKIERAPAWLKWPSIAYVVGACIYMAYCEETQTGLVGYVMAIEMERFGSSTGAFGIGILVFALPLFAILAGFERLAPEKMRTVMPLRAQTGNREITWKRVVVTTCIPLLATLVAVPIIYLLTQARLKEPILNVDVTDAGAATPGSGSLVAASGLVARRYLASFRYGNHTHSTDHLYVPLIAPSWTPTDPLQFIVHEEVSVDNWDQPLNVPYDLSQSHSVQIQGRLSKSLPVVIERAFAGKGLTLAPSYLVIEKTGIPTAYWAEFAPAVTGVVGVMLAAFTLCLMMLMKYRRR